MANCKQTGNARLLLLERMLNKALESKARLKVIHNAGVTQSGIAWQTLGFDRARVFKKGRVRQTKCDRFYLEFYLKIYIAEARAEDTQDIVDICNDNREQSEDEMVIETECTPDCCSLTRDKPNQPTEKTVLAKTKKFQAVEKQTNEIQLCAILLVSKYRWLSLGTLYNDE